MQDRTPHTPHPPPADGSAPLQAGLAALTQDGGDVRTRIRLITRLRNYFLTGLVVVGPVAITLYLAWYFVDSADRWVKPYIPKWFNPDSYSPLAIPGIGLVAAIMFLTMIGALAANLLGRSLIAAGEVMLGRMPIVRNVYRGTKQIFESVVTASGPEQRFQKVALMEFPSKGIWAIVFVTGEAVEAIQSVSPSDDLVSVFMPTHFLPPSGFVVFVPRGSIVPIDLSVEDAAKIIISAGMVNPKAQKVLGDLATATRNGERTVRPKVPAA
jgi:uncharacterized membrane protein